MAAVIYAQPNCNVYLWNKDTAQYNACKISEEFNHYYQFDMRGIAILDSSLTVCPYYAYANYEYGVVYLKAGNFVEWNKYINAAVKSDPVTYLGLRASCRGKFFADYIGAINDIDSLDLLIDYDIGFVHDGTYHLDAYKALCYKALNEFELAIELFEKHLKNNFETIGVYDYLHTGVAYQNIGDHQKAIEYFTLQESSNDLAENNYYKAMSYLELGDLDNFNQYIKRAEELLQVDQKITNGFHIMEDEIFLTDVTRLKEAANLEGK